MWTVIKDIVNGKTWSYMTIFIVIIMKLPLKQWVCALCIFLIGKVIPEFHLHAVLIDMVRYVYRGDALKCADCLFYDVFRNDISAIFKFLHQGQIANALYFRPAIISIFTLFIFFPYGRHNKRQFWWEVVIWWWKISGNTMLLAIINDHTTLVLHVYEGLFPPPPSNQRVNTFFY